LSEAVDHPEPTDPQSVEPDQFALKRFGVLRNTIGQIV
jgi:hypothetical protein